MTGRGTPSSDSKKKYLGLSAEAWGVVGAIAGVAGVLIALLPHFGSSNGAPGSPNSPSESARPSGIQPSPVPSASPASSQGFSRQWGTGTLLITKSNTDLDSVPPNVNSDGGGTDMSVSPDGQLSDSSHLVAWTSARRPTAAECANLISTQGVAELKPFKGEVICAGTDQENIAVLVMERVDVDSSDYLSAILAQVTVWSNSE
jgi:hypothetical protein